MGQDRNWSMIRSWMVSGLSSKTGPVQVLWCPVDADNKAYIDNCPHFWDPDLPSPIRCEVRAGEVLYLPAGWYHRCEPSCAR